MERRFGWDTHGLPAEMEAERELGISGRKAEIDAMGIGSFNDACRESVLRYTDDWQRYVTRQARWVDFENDYKTLDLSLHGERDVGVQADCGTRAWPTRASGCCPTAGATKPRCPTTNCGWTTTSTRAARTRRSRWASRSCRSATAGAVRGKVGLLVWTTTPWTLPSNLAVAVDPEIVTYVRGPGR